MTIRDVGYKPYEGPRLPHRTRYRVLIRRTWSLHWSSGLLKAAFIVGMLPMLVCGVWIVVKLWAARQLAATGVPAEMLAEKLGNPADWIFYCMFWCQIWFAFAISLLAAAPAISDDVRTGAFQFYFARPVSRNHYLLGKLVPVWLLLLLTITVPGLALSLVRIAFAKSGAEVWQAVPLIPITLFYGLVFSAVLSLVPLALSALGLRSGAAQGTWAAVFFLPWILGEALASATDVPYAALCSIPTNLRLLGQRLFGMPQTYSLHWLLPAGVLLVLLAGAALARGRRLERVEVFS
jgi:ABC-2 type transport system permease protein